MKIKFAIIGSVLCILFFFLIIFVAGTFLISPSPKKIGPPPQDLAVQPVSFNSESGSLISGWFIPGQQSKGGILLLHGIHSNRLQMLERARILNKHGYSVLLFDFQAHGESTGKHITFGFLEALDAEAGFAFLETKLSNKSIGIVGFSLGGAAALLGNAAGKANALVLESVYPTIDEAIENRLKMLFGNPGKYLVPLLTFQIQQRLGFSYKELRPIDKISHVKGAVFIINGDQDKHTTTAESQRIFEYAHDPKIFWKVEGASHGDAFKFNRDEYGKRILSFFDSYL